MIENRVKSKKKVKGKVKKKMLSATALLHNMFVSSRNIQLKEYLSFNKYKKKV